MFKKLRLKSKPTKSMGFMPKQRTRAEVDQDYCNTAIQYGHKSRVLAQAHREIETMEAELQRFMDRLMELNKEGMALPPEEKPPAEAVQAAPATSPIQPEALQ